MSIVLLLSSTLVATAACALAFHRQRRFEQLRQFTQRLLRRDAYVSHHTNLDPSRFHHQGRYAGQFGILLILLYPLVVGLRRRRRRKSRARARKRNAAAGHRSFKGIHRRRRRSPKGLGCGTAVL